MEHGPALRRGEAGAEKRRREVRPAVRDAAPAEAKRAPAGDVHAAPRRGGTLDELLDDELGRGGVLLEVRLEPVGGGGCDRAL